MDAVVVTAKQLVERPTVSPLGCSHQLVVGELCCDGGETTSRRPTQVATKFISEMSPRYGFLVHSGVFASCLNITNT